jgi:hypothetical protein
MRLRSRRRDVVVWVTSAGPAGRHDGLTRARLERPRPIRRCIRLGALLTVIGLVRLASAVRPRWRPVLAGVVFTVVGVVLRSGPGGLVLIPGLMFLLYSPLIEGRSDKGRKRRLQLERELAGYATPAQRRDLEATLDRYPDGITREIREILAGQAVAAGNRGIPGTGRF